MFASSGPPSRICVPAALLWALPCSLKAPLLFLDLQSQPRLPRLTLGALFFSLQAALQEWHGKYNDRWLVARHGYQTPAQIRRTFVDLDAAA